MADPISAVSPETQIKNFTMNFGPQRSAAHGVLRLVLEMDGEVVERADAHTGRLHRGTEQLIEYNTYLQAETYFGHPDSAPPLCHGHAAARRDERLRANAPPVRAQ